MRILYQLAIFDWHLRLPQRIEAAFGNNWNATIIVKNADTARKIRATENA